MIISNELPEYIQSTTRNMIMWKLLNYCLNWVRDEGIEKPVAFIVMPKQPHQILFGKNSITWIPEKIAPQEKTLKVSEWAEIDDPAKVTLKMLKGLLKTNLKECELREIALAPGVKGIEILWPSQLGIKIDEDVKLTKNRKGISPTYSILTVISKKPNWITAGYSKGGVFKNRLPCGFKDKNVIVYEGLDATYIFNNNGLKYLKANKVKPLRENKDYVHRIDHDENSYDKWKDELDKYI